MAVDERLPDGAGASAPTTAPPLARAAAAARALVLGSTFWGWAGPVLVMIFGGFLRFYRLSQPDAVVFDETYYVPGRQLDPASRRRAPARQQRQQACCVDGNPNIFLSIRTASCVARSSRTRRSARS